MQDQFKPFEVMSPSNFNLPNMQNADSGFNQSPNAQIIAQSPYLIKMEFQPQIEIFESEQAQIFDSVPLGLMYNTNEVPGQHKMMHQRHLNENVVLKKIQFDFSNDHNSFITPFRPLFKRPLNTDFPKQENPYQMQPYTEAKKGHDHKNKGLRFLSSKVKEIVNQEQCTSYKQMAERLIEQLEQEFCVSRQKEEQNIKRRVYDALNVMIAINVLNKAGKRVLPIKNKPFNPRGQNSQTIQELLDQNKATKERCAQKQLKVQENIFRHLAFLNLIKRNKLISKPELVFNFPILLINGDIENGETVLQTIDNKQVLIVSSKEQINLTSDLDLLVRLDLQKTEIGKLKKIIGQDLLRMITEKQMQIITDV